MTQCEYILYTVPTIHCTHCTLCIYIYTYTVYMYMYMYMYIHVHVHMGSLTRLAVDEVDDVISRAATSIPAEFYMMRVLNTDCHNTQQLHVHVYTCTPSPSP